jgi:hypothetical protein
LDRFISIYRTADTVAFPRELFLKFNSGWRTAKKTRRAQTIETTGSSGKNREHRKEDGERVMRKGAVEGGRGVSMTRVSPGYSYSILAQMFWISKSRGILDFRLLIGD